MFRGQKKQVIDDSMSVFYVTYCLQSNLDLRRRTRIKLAKLSLLRIMASALWTVIEKRLATSGRTAVV